MSGYEAVTGKVLSVRRLTADVLDFMVECPTVAAKAAPGQFAQLYVPGHTLRRPISICEIDPAAGTLRFVFQIRGSGTADLARLNAWDPLDLLAPLGKGFPLLREGKTLLLGGGIGVPPLLGVARALGDQAIVGLGFRSKAQVILEEDFRATGAKVLLATDDGSAGYHGVVTQAAAGETFDRVCACGPLPMLKAAKALAEERGVPCWLSLEERMACGIGACLGCAVLLLEEDGTEHYGHVCKDGPVFDSRRLAL